MKFTKPVRGIVCLIGWLAGLGVAYLIYLPEFPRAIFRSFIVSVSPPPICLTFEEHQKLSQELHDPAVQPVVGPNHDQPIPNWYQRISEYRFNWGTLRQIPRFVIVLSLISLFFSLAAYVVCRNLLPTVVVLILGNLIAFALLPLLAALAVHSQ